MSFGIPIYIFGGASTVPTITSLNYTVGDTAGGGQSIVITGTNLDTASSVTFGGTSATITGQTSTTCTVTLPAKSAGLYDVVVTNPSGSATSTNAFRYWNPSVPSGADIYLDSNKGWDSGTKEWTDQTSSVVWSPSATTPTQSASQFGSLPGISYNGTNQYHSIGTPRSAGATSSNSCVAFVGKWTSSDASAIYPDYGAPLNVIGYSIGLCGFGASAGNIAFSAYDSGMATPSGQITTSSGKNDGSPHFAMVNCTYGTDYYEIYVDSSTASTTGSGAYMYCMDLVGASGGYVDLFNGYLGCVYFGKSFLGSTDVERFYQWSRQRFGVA